MSLASVVKPGGVPMAVAPWIVPDGLWERIEPLLPKVERRFRYPGRKRLDDRAALQGILFVLQTGIAWRHVPLEFGFGSGSTCYRRLDEWQQAGVWEGLHALLLAELRAADEIEWSRAVADSSHVQAKKGGSETGPSPVDRARNGSKHHLLVDSTGIPLAWSLTGGNRNDVIQLIPLVERVPPVRGRVGRPRRRRERVTADRGYDHDKYRRELRGRGIAPEIARRQTEHGSGLGRIRWVVERTFAWLHHFKRLLVRYDRRAEIHQAFLALGCCLVCFRRLQRSL
jgi:transposase